MSIKPIDMQTNIAQMHEVARNAQVKTEAVVEQHAHTRQESLEKSRLTKPGSRKTRRPKRTPSCVKRRGVPAADRTRGTERGGHRMRRRLAALDEKIGRIIDVKK